MKKRITGGVRATAKGAEDSKVSGFFEVQSGCGERAVKLISRNFSLGNFELNPHAFANVPLSSL